MPTRAELAGRYLQCSFAGDADGVMALVTGDVVLERPIVGTVSGKEALGAAITSRPMAAAGFAPTLDEPVENGDEVRIKGRLPAGSPFPIPSMTWTFSFEGDKIRRIEVGL